MVPSDPEAHASAIIKDCFKKHLIYVITLLSLSWEICLVCNSAFVEAVTAYTFISRDYSISLKKYHRMLCNNLKRSELELYVSYFN